MCLKSKHIILNVWFVKKDLLCYLAVVYLSSLCHSDTNKLYLPGFLFRQVEYGAFSNNLYWTKSVMLFWVFLKIVLQNLIKYRIHSNSSVLAVASLHWLALRALFSCPYMHFQCHLRCPRVFVPVARCCCRTGSVDTSSLLCLHRADRYLESLKACQANASPQMSFELMCPVT